MLGSLNFNSDTQYFQVVAGMKYRLQIRIGTTNCRKGRDDRKDLATECDLNNVS